MIDEFNDANRRAAWRLECAFDQKLPSGFTEKYYPLTTRELRELRRLKAAMRLARTPEAYMRLAHHLPVERGLLNLPQDRR